MICWLLIAVFLVAGWLIAWSAFERVQRRHEADQELISRLIDLVAALHRKRLLDANDSRLLGWTLEESRR